MIEIELGSKRLKTEAFVIDGLLYDVIICYEDLRRLQLSGTLGSLSSISVKI